MAWREGRKRGGGGIDLDLSPEDRTGAPPGDSSAAPDEPSERPNKKPAKRGAPRRRRRGADAATRQSRKGKRTGRTRSMLGRAAYWGAVLALWALIGGIGALVWIGIRLPPIQSLEIPKRPPSVLILGVNGATLATRGDMGGAAVAIGELPDYVPNAFIAIEDRRFYSHRGVDPFGIARALVADIFHRGAAQGGSTITQQLAKNLFLTQERTITRKLQEIVLALWLEHKFSKTQILELYLNRVYFGAGAYGIEGAAQRYFGKSARHLTLAEAAMLAGLVQAPSRLAPSRNPAGAERRAALVLADMVELKMIAPASAKLALARPAHAIKPPAAGSVNYVADWVMDAVNDLIGKFDQDIVVDTTIDPALQNAAEHALVDTLNAKGDKLNIGQGALVAMTPDGVVRALVGGRDYGDSQFDRAVDAKRQPGSAFKPFVYLTALEHGLTPETVREDAPIAVKGWRPENYERQYLGAVTLRQALADSLNTVSVRLTLEFGPAAVVRTAYRLGIASILEPNASIALGTSEVSPLELVSAYATFANGGLAVSPHIVERIRGADGKTLYGRSQQQLGRIVDARYVGMMNAMLHETLVSGTARGANLPGWQAAGKTGTSQDFRDAWFIGYTSRLVAGIWLGNDDNSPTKRAVGGGMPVEIWSRFMRTALAGTAPTALPGIADGTWFNPPPAFAPPAPADAQSDSRRDNSGGLDSWLLDKLFGRR
ncbi:MAG TPA: PBP1A family penicillin-binding protein [Xanthobacteraceae bacterium]|nr:PBP1A family penicillin-binding protein [Xanthobacteraceae bacterium]